MFDNYMTVVWIIVTIIAIIVEVMTQQLVSIWFVVAGIICTVLAWLLVPAPLQMLAFVIISTVSFMVAKRYLQPYVASKVTATNADRVIGQEGIVTRDLVTHQRGEIRVNGQFWTARSDDPELRIKEGTPVTIRAIEGATLIVVPLEDS